MHLRSRPTKIISLLQSSNGVIKDLNRPQVPEKSAKIQKVSPLSITITQKEYLPVQVPKNHSKNSYSIQKIEFNSLNEPTPTSSPTRQMPSFNLSVKQVDSKYRPNSAGNKLLFMKGKFRQSFTIRRRRLSGEETLLIAGSSFRSKGFRKDFSFNRRKSLFN